MDALPVAADEVKKTISAFIEKEGLETVTSSKIRSHLMKTFNEDFQPYKKQVDQITREIIEEQQKNNDSDSDSDIDAAPVKKDDTPEPENSAETSSSDDGVLYTERARPVKKSLKRKASDNEENLDLMSSVKSGRRTAAKEAANKLRKSAGWSNRKKVTSEKKEKGKITKGTKLVYVSDELQAIVGQKFMRRCDVVKECWKYMRENDRMDPKDKRFAIIQGDPALERVFKGKKRIQMFGVMSHLSHRHLLTPEDVGPELVEECELYREKLIADFEASRVAGGDTNSDDESENENSKDLPDETSNDIPDEAEENTNQAATSDSD